MLPPPGTVVCMVARHILQDHRSVSHMLQRFTPEQRSTTSHPTPRVSLADLFVLNRETYFIIGDYYSRSPEVVQLTSHSVINALKAVFAHHGIPETFISHNRLQYISREFTEFAASYWFVHTTNSPHYPQSNDLTKRTVKTVKKLLLESTDQPLALLPTVQHPYHGADYPQLNCPRVDAFIQVFNRESGT